MGHGMTGVVGNAAMTGIEIALWDIEGKALNVPVRNLLGGEIRDQVRMSPCQNGGAGPGACRLRLQRPQGRRRRECGQQRRRHPQRGRLRRGHHGGYSRTALADDQGRHLKGPGSAGIRAPLLRGPCSPGERRGAGARGGVNIPIMVGERHSHIYGERELIEREIVNVVQPDTGRAGGLMQMKKIAAMAEAHYITMAPHDGSLSPVAEMAAVPLIATLANFLILEHRADDVPQRYEVMESQPEVIDSYIEVPDGPGLGVDIVEESIAKYPSQGNVIPPNPNREHLYFQTREQCARWLEKPR